MNLKFIFKNSNFSFLVGYSVCTVLTFKSHLDGYLEVGNIYRWGSFYLPMLVAHIPVEPELGSVPGTWGCCLGRERMELLGKMAFSELSKALLWCWQTVCSPLLCFCISLCRSCCKLSIFKFPLHAPSSWKKMLTSLFTEKLKAGSYGVNIHALWW